MQSKFQSLTPNAVERMSPDTNLDYLVRISLEGGWKCLLTAGQVAFVREEEWADTAMSRTNIYTHCVCNILLYYLINHYMTIINDFVEEKFTLLNKVYIYTIYLSIECEYFISQILITFQLLSFKSCQCKWTYKNKNKTWKNWCILVLYHFLKFKTS